VLHEDPAFEEYSIKYPVIAEPLSAGAVHETPISPLLYGLFRDVTVAVTPVTCAGALYVGPTILDVNVAVFPVELVATTTHLKY
jgi:hypothetical protein